MIGSATHGDGPGASAPGPSRGDRILDLLDHPGQHYDPWGGVSQALVDALLPAVEALAATFALFGEAVTAAFRSLVALLHSSWGEAACIDFAVTEMGVARSDVRAVVFAGHRRCPAPHVQLWNHRRIPFPPGSGPALAWSRP